MTKKRIIKYLAEKLYLEDYSVSTVLEQLSQYPKDAIIEFYVDDGYDFLFSVFYIVEETDEEYNKRIADEKEAEIAKKNKLFSDYLQLKAMFEDMEK